jgi:light-harvesting complex II chlorophyll a/b binding protein 4
VTPPCASQLATVGWPLAELVNPWSLGVTGGRAPSLFNGGLGDYSLFLLLAAAYAAYLELGTTDAVYQTWLKAPETYVAGDLGFDPLGLSAEEGAFLKRKLRGSELFNGRLAMLAITGFAVQEFLWDAPVVEQTPFFFGK